EHERLDHAGVPHLGLLARVVARRARRLRGPVGADEVRVAHRRAALGDLPEPATVAALPARLRRRHDRGVLGGAARAEPLPRAARLLGPDDPVAGEQALAVVALGLA